MSPSFKFCYLEKKGYKFKEDHLIQRGGSLTTYSVSIGLLKKVQRVTLKQSWIQRIRSRANIIFHFASGLHSLPYLQLADAQSMRSVVEHKIRGSTKILPGDQDHYESGEYSNELEKEWTQLPKRYLVRQVIGKIIHSFVVFVPVLFGLAWLLHWSFAIELNHLALPFQMLFAALLLWRLVRVGIEVPRYRYSLTVDKLTIQTSFLSRNTEIARFSRLQAVSSTNNWLDRVFCLSNLNLYTAEGMTKVKELRDRDAFRLREFISSRLIEIANTGDDALSMLERDSTVNDGDGFQTRHQQIEWNKFSGWKLMLTCGLLAVIFLVPQLLLGINLMMYPVFHLEVTPAYIHDLHELKSWPIWLAVYIVISISLMLIPFIRIPCQGYRLSESTLRYKQGLVSRKDEFIPIGRIQNVSVLTTFVHRVFKVRSIMIASPGFSNILAFLPVEETEQLHRFLMSRTQNSNVEVES